MFLEVVLDIIAWAGRNRRSMLVASKISAIVMVYRAIVHDCNSFRIYAIKSKMFLPLTAASPSLEMAATAEMLSPHTIM